MALESIRPRSVPVLSVRTTMAPGMAPPSGPVMRPRTDCPERGVARTRVRRARYRRMEEREQRMQERNRGEPQQPILKF